MRYLKFSLLALTLGVPLQAFAFLGMNAAATLQGPLPAWTKQLGATGGTVSSAFAATDSSGNVFVAGYTDTGLDGNTQTGTTDFYLTKYNASGAKQWTKQLGVASQDTQANAVATDSSGNVFVSGYTSGGLDGKTLTGTADCFVIALDSTGAKLWTTLLGVASQITKGTAVTTDISGNVFIAGTTTGGLDGNTLSGAGSTDIFVTKYNSSGTKLWTKQFGTGQTIGTALIANGAAADPSGNVFVGGVTAYSINGQPKMGYNDFYVVKYDPSGTLLWTRQLGAPTAFVTPKGVSSDSSGNVFIAGYTDTGLDGNTQAGNLDLFVTKYDSNGSKQWTRQLGSTSGSTIGKAVATDLFGNVFVSGNTSSSLDGNLQKGTQDCFITKYTSSGVKQWTKQLGVASKSITAFGAAISPLGHLYVTGTTNGSVDNNTQTGTKDFFVSQYIGN